MSRSISVPGATSIKARPCPASWNTARSVVVEDFLPGPLRVGGRKSDALHTVDELAHLPRLHNLQTVLRPLQACALRIEGPAKDHLFGVLGDLDKPSRPDQVAAG